jgi:hypothetical protein
MVRFELSGVTLKNNNTKSNSDHMRCLYQKDERALPGNLQTRKYRFFLFYAPQM